MDRACKFDTNCVSNCAGQSSRQTGYPIPQLRRCSTHTKWKPGQGSHTNVGCLEESSDIASSSSGQQTTFDPVQVAHWALSQPPLGTLFRLHSIRKPLASSNQSGAIALAFRGRCGRILFHESDVFQRNETAEGGTAHGLGTSGRSQSAVRRRYRSTPAH